ELRGIPNKENGSIVADHIPVAFLGVELHRKSAWVTDGIGCAARASDHRKASNEVGLLAFLGEEVGARVLADLVVRDRERPERAAAFRVDDAFRDLLPVELSHLFGEMVIVQQEWSLGTGATG